MESIEVSKVIETFIKVFVILGMVKILLNNKEVRYQRLERCYKSMHEAVFNMKSAEDIISKYTKYYPFGLNCH